MSLLRYATLMTTALRRSTRLLSASSTEVSNGTTKTTSRSTATMTVASTSTRGSQQSRSIHTTGEAEESSLRASNPKKRARKEPDVEASESALEDWIEEQLAEAKPKRARKKAGPVEYNVSDFPTRPKSPWKIGPHVSAAGGVENAVLNAASIGYVHFHWEYLSRLKRIQNRATAFALFLKSQRKWESAPLTQESIDTFKKRLTDFGYEPKHVLPHGNYLVNLGNPDA